MRFPTPLGGSSRTRNINCKEKPSSIPLPSPPTLNPTTLPLAVGKNKTTEHFPLLGLEYIIQNISGIYPYYNRTLKNHYISKSENQSEEN